MSKETSPLNIASKQAALINYTDGGKPDQASIIEKSQQYRAESSLKWHVVAWNCCCFVATYHCFYSISALQNSLMDAFNLNDLQFSLLTTMSFAFALVGALVTPLIVNMYGLYVTTLLGQITATIGQSLFFVGVLLTIRNGELAFLLMYLGRMLVGFAVGIDEVTVLSITTLWFGASKWSSLALMIVVGTFELGAITCRYVLIPFLDATGLPLAYAFSIGIVIAVISVFAAFAIMYLERKFVKEMDKVGVIIEPFTMDHNFLKVFKSDEGGTGFSLQLWLVVMYCWLTTANILTYVAEMTDPFMAKYGFTEWTSDLVLSCCSVGNLLTAPLWGWLVARFGGLVYYQIIGSVAMMISCAMYSWVPSDFYPDVMPWIAISLFIFATELCFVAAFESTYVLCPKNLIAIATSINSIGYLVGSVSITVGFGAIADEWNYNWSVALLFAVASAAFIVSILTFIVDMRGKRLLSRRTSEESGLPQWPQVPPNGTPSHLPI